MESISLKTGGWLALAVVAFMLIPLAADSAFAVHLGIVSAAAMIAMVVTLKGADWNGLTRGLLPPAADSGRYDDDMVRLGVIATLVWGIVGMLVGVLIASQLNFWQANLETSWLTFGRLRPLHRRSRPPSATGRHTIRARHIRGPR